MEPRYYLALFNEQSWKEFLGNGAKIYGTTKNKLNRARKICQGDYLLCYVSKLSILSGVLKVESDVYYDESKYWTNDLFPVRFNVNPEILLSLDEGMTPSIFREDLDIFKNLRQKSSWGGFFINSFNEFPEEDGKFLVQILRRKVLVRKIRDRTSKGKDFQ